MCLSHSFICCKTELWTPTSAGCGAEQGQGPSNTAQQDKCEWLLLSLLLPVLWSWIQYFYQERYLESRGKLTEILPSISETTTAYLMGLVMKNRLKTPSTRQSHHTKDQTSSSFQPQQQGKTTLYSKVAFMMVAHCERCLWGSRVSHEDLICQPTSSFCLINLYFFLI